MKSTAKVFIILSMVFGVFAIFPLVVGILALQKLSEARTADELKTMGIITLIFCSTIGGILMLCIKDEDLAENRVNNQQYDNQTSAPVQPRPVEPPVQPRPAQPQVNQEETSFSTEKLEEELTRIQSLYAKKALTKEEYESLRAQVLKKYLK